MKYFNSAGQVTVEFILIFALLLSVFLAVKSQLFDQNQYLAKFVQGPWSVVSGMIENGVWAPANKAKLQHPGHLRRHLQLTGVKEK